MSRALTVLILVVASAVGLVAFLYPFVVPAALTAGGSMGLAHAADAPLLFVLLVVLCLGAVVSSLSAGTLNTKLVAVLGVLAALNAVLRLVPGPAGFNAVFALPVLAGYAYGPTFGFLLGALSLLVSAFLGGGVGPWLPFQMFATGWVGLTSAWLPRLQRWPRAEIVMLAAWAGALGFLFGALMNVWFWPYVFSGAQPGQYWEPGLGLADTLQRYAVFYLTTSLWWDLGRAAGNVLLVGLFGWPVLRLLRRFGRRFYFQLALPHTAPPGGEG